MEGDVRVFPPVSMEIISIHSLRMEGDLDGHRQALGCMLFQSTPSAWRETEFLPKIGFRIGISIHSLRMEGDLSRIMR